MPNKAKPQKEKDRAKSILKEKWMQWAIEIYREEQTRPNPRGLNKICAQAEVECLRLSHKMVTITKSSLHRRVHGGQSHMGAAGDQRWLNNVETEVMLEDIIQNAARGFPPSHRRIKEHIDEIARARHGSSFLETGVGQNWTHWFTSNHSDRIGIYWSKALDKSRARAVNPYTKEGYFAILDKVTTGDGGDDCISNELKYGVDESGFQKGVGQRERVFGGKGKKTQHQQRSGDRENITVIVTICGDGTSIAPAVIFKGNGFQSSWKQDNPANASLGYSKKGYTDGKIGRAWIENFHNQTMGYQTKMQVIMHVPARHTT